MSSTPGRVGGKTNGSKFKIKVNLKKKKSAIRMNSCIEKSKLSNSISPIPILPNLQCIIDNQPQLLPSGTHFKINESNAGNNNNNSSNNSTLSFNSGSVSC